MPPHGTPWPGGTPPPHLLISEGGNHLPSPPPCPTTKNARWLFPLGASTKHITQC